MSDARKQAALALFDKLEGLRGNPLALVKAIDGIIAFYCRHAETTDPEEAFPLIKADGLDQRLDAAMNWARFERWLDEDESPLQSQHRDGDGKFKLP